ncbi:MAG TPA: peptidoglycan editing factor PgeF [Bacteroidales bacterium]|nr:peptidoglycan editing factor PgeF [Bacteroidales bacterium]HOU98259.1 peptidoglycan editing factor PgeF [Bacteroidales bacterium]
MNQYVIKRFARIAWVEFPILSQFPELVHFSSLRMGGVSNHPQASLNMGFVRTDFTNNVIENRKSIAKALNISIENMIFSRQTHSDHISIVTIEDKGKGVFYKPTAIQDNDGYLVSQPNICPVVLTADCVPVFLYDPVEKIAAVVHSGWRGTVQHISAKAAKKMISLGSQAKNIVAAIGPSAGSCCYNVGYDVYNAFLDAYGNAALNFFSSTTPPFTIDLWNAIRLSLSNEGILNKNIAQTNLCTICNPHLFFSSRNNKGMTGRMASGIMIR